MGPHLTNNEIGVLRYILDSHERREEVVFVSQGGWPPSAKPPHEFGEQFPAYPEVRTCLVALKRLELLAVDWNINCVWATGRGRQWLWEYDHPDIVEKAREWARRHPRVAPWIIAYTVSGAALGWVALILSLIATAIALYWR